MNDAPNGDEPATPTTTKGPPCSSVSALYVPLKPHTHHKVGLYHLPCAVKATTNSSSDG